MSARARQLLTWCLLAVGVASVAIASRGGMRGTVTDSSGAPLAKVTVTLLGADFDFERVVTTSKRGVFNITVADATRAYLVRLEKDGYVTWEQPFKLSAGQVANGEWVLYSEAEAADQSAQLKKLRGKDEAAQAYNRGAEAYNAKDVEAATAHLREAIAADPNLALAHAALGRVLLENERWGEARAAAEAFLEVNPDQPLGLELLYDAHWGAGDVPSAGQVLKRLLAVDTGPHLAGRVYNQAVAAIDIHAYDAAAEGFVRALELDPGLVQGLLPLAQIHHGRGDWQAAVDAAEGYLEHDAANARANIVRYLSYQELGNQEAAEKAFADLETNSPLAAAELFLRDAMKLYHAGSVAAATEAALNSIKLDPDNPQAHHQLGLCYASTGENDKARVELEKFLELAPDHPEAATVRDMLTYLE